MDTQRGSSRNGNVGFGMVAGFAAGILATVAMTAFQQLWSKASETLSHEHDREHLHSPHRGTGSQPESDDATMKAADRLGQKILHRQLSREEKEKAGPLLHFLVGGLTGALYGGLAEMMPAIRAGQGTAYATLVFVLGDEIAVPQLGLSKSAAESPLSSHLYGWASHLVYGLANEWARRGVRFALASATEWRSHTDREQFYYRDVYHAA